MKALLIFLLGSFAATTFINAQSPVPDPDTLSTVKQTDPAPDVLPPGMNYTEDRVKVTPGDIPAEVKRTLASGSQYEGWQKGNVYKNKKGNLYIIEITKGDTMKTFRFDRLGRPATE